MVYQSRKYLLRVLGKDKERKKVQTNTSLKYYDSLSVQVTNIFIFVTWICVEYKYLNKDYKECRLVAILLNSRSEIETII